MGIEDVRSTLTLDPLRLLFAADYHLVPQLNEVYELELAYLESNVLSAEEIVQNGAYFARVGDHVTRHVLMAGGSPIHFSKEVRSRLRAFFEVNQFKTGYATHGLFPYRGKFHPQMIKAIMNVIGLKAGQVVLDPMMGSGTVLVEASLMGIRSIGVDSSPFCRFMTQAKLDAMTAPHTSLTSMLEDPEEAFLRFSDIGGSIDMAADTGFARTLFSSVISPDGDEKPIRAATGPDRGSDNVLLLAFLDSVGLSQRSTRRTPLGNFASILKRYGFVIEKIKRAVTETSTELAPALPLDGDARSLPIATGSVDGIVFSPPYSFAIDYVENDEPHLDFLGVDVGAMRKRMIGLRGKNLREKFERYQSDMDEVLAECARALHLGALCAIIVGTNRNQLGRILDIPKSEVEGIDEMMIRLAAPHGLRLVRKIERQITGMANTMRSEFIVLMERV